MFRYGIAVLLLGILGASSWIISKRPDAKGLLDRIAPYQGWGGLLFVLWGLWTLFQILTNMGHWSEYFVSMVVILICALLEIVLGLILGAGTLRSFVKDEKALAKVDSTVAKLSPFRTTLGFAAIGMGLVCAVLHFMPI